MIEATRRVFGEEAVTAFPLCSLNQPSSSESQGNVQWEVAHFEIFLCSLCIQFPYCFGGKGKFRFNSNRLPKLFFGFPLVDVTITAVI